MLEATKQLFSKVHTDKVEAAAKKRRLQDVSYEEERWSWEENIDTDDQALQPRLSALQSLIGP